MNPHTPESTSQPNSTAQMEHNTSEKGGATPSVPNEFPESVQLTGANLSLQEFLAIAIHSAHVEISPEAQQRVHSSRKVVSERIQEDKPFYGINTGFGALAKMRVSSENLAKLQINLIRSHACGVGDPLPNSVVRGILALRIQTMIRGHSGVRWETVDLMRSFLNEGISPLIPSQGSVGASGDLAPLAHLALSLIGEGMVFFKGNKVNAAVALKATGLKALQPEAKEGLSLINGTQVMTTLGLLGCAEVAYLLHAADSAAAMTLDATRGTPAAFADEVQQVRAHPFQATVARNVRELLKDDPIVESHLSCEKVQDPYSIRCVPQVHGAVRAAHSHALEILLCEANSSTDNPLVFPETGKITSGGNFHGAPVSYVLDYLAIALTDLGSISERRIEKLVNPHLSGLPPFLTEDCGLNSGHMITHVVAAALTNENKVLAHPASTDSIPTSAEQEDHVSMGMTSANKLEKIIQNVAHILSIELIAGAQGVEFHKPLKPSRGISAVWKFVRQHSAFMNEDRSLSQDIAEVKKSLLRGKLYEATANEDISMQ